MTRHVVVLKGGWSVEREVSLVSGAAVAEALRGQNYRVSEIDVGRTLAADLAAAAPDIVFNALHGRWGEDGCVQGLCEVMGLAYTHSGVLASALAMDKPRAKTLFAAAGIPCPEGEVITRDAFLAGPRPTPPYVVKPLNEGSSVGVVIVHDEADLDVSAHTEAWRDCERLLVERFIPGRELTVAVMDGAALGVLELRPKQGFYDYQAKYTEGLVEHVMPAPVRPEVHGRVMALAERAHRCLGCRGITRADFRYDDGNGGPKGVYLLEVNTQPGMTPLSLVPEIAGYRDIDFGRLVGWMVEDASCGR